MKSAVAPRKLVSLNPLARLVPDISLPHVLEQGRASLGAFFGVLSVALVMPLLVNSGADVPLLVAPIGASAVLLFAAPSSPLAQPWSILGGNVSAALVAVLCRTFIPDPMIAAPVAVGAAIAVMFALRCLHPPGGAVAVFTVLVAPGSQELGYSFALMPVGLSSLVLAGAAVLFNNSTGRRYPHRLRDASPPQHHVVRSEPPRISAADLDMALERFGEVMPIDRADLAQIVHDAEKQARRRHLALLSAGDVMRRDFATVLAGAALAQAWKALQRSDHDAIVIVDASGRTAGLATEADLLRLGRRTAQRPGPRAMRIVRSAGIASARWSRLPAMPVRDLPVARIDASAESLARMMHAARVQHLAITDHAGKLVGLVWMGDLLPALTGDLRVPIPDARAA